MNSTIDSVIFDLDGTLWDASESCSRAWNEALKRAGKSHHVIDENLVRSFSGLKLDSIMQKSFTFLDTAEQAALTQHYQECEMEFMQKFGGQLYPDVREVLTELKTHFKLFIVSNCLAGYIENFLEFHKLEDFFTDYECSGNTGLAKADNIKRIVSRNRLHSPIYVGDTVWDQQAAEQNSIPFVFATYGFGTAPGALVKIDALKDLLTFPA